MSRGVHFLRAAGQQIRRLRTVFGNSSSPRSQRRLICEPLEERQLLAITVEGIAPTPSGFVAEFSEQVEIGSLNLYDAENEALGEADVTLQGASVGAVPGSLVVNDNELTFIATGGPLAADTYTVTLRSDADAIVDEALGELLDGEYTGSFPSGNGTAGGDFVYSFSVDAPQPLVVGFSDFARGPTQPVQAPAQGSGEELPDGLLLQFSDADGVTSGTLKVTYDPELLTITAVQLGPDAPTNMLVEANLTTPGEAVIAFAIPGDPLAAGAADLIEIIAEVPEDATYGAAQILDISNLEINAGAIEATADDAVHAVVFAGDANANRRYDAEDARLIARVGVKLDTGFAVDQPTEPAPATYDLLYPTIDPEIIGDVTGKQGLSALDASDILRYVTGLDTPNIQALPDAQGPTGLTLSDSDVAEDQAVGTVVGTFTTTDPDTGDTHTYTLVAGDGDDDNDSFTIDGGQLKTAELFDVDAQDTYTIRVRTTDSTDRYMEQTFTITVTADSQAPTATITPDSTTSNDDPIVFTVTFDEDVTGFDVGDLSASGSVTGALSLANFTTVSATQYTVEVGGMESSEDVTLTLTASGSGIVDDAINAMVDDATATVTYVDAAAPIATITPNSTTINDDPIVFTITFDEDVTGFESKVDLSATGSTSGELTITTFTQVSPSEYTVQVSGMASDESVTLTLTASGSGIEDEAGNALATDATAIVTYVDATAPTATITPDGSLGNAEPIVFTVTFDEEVTGVDVSDLSASGSVSGDLTLANFTAVSTTEYTVEVSGMSADEEVTLTVTASGSGIVDEAVNAMVVDAIATVTYDTTAPAATITPNSTTGNDDPIVFTITFDEDVTGVDVADLSATGSVTGDLSLANFTAVSATEYTVEVTGMDSDESVTLTLTASGSGITDEATNLLAADADAVVTYVDATAPTAAIAPNGTTDDADPIVFTITFDEAVSGVDVGDLSATGSASSSLTLSNFTAVSATEYTVKVTGMALDEEVTLTLTASGSGIEDEASNALATDATATVTYVDVKAPIATIAPSATTSNDDPILFTIGFDEVVTGFDVADLSATGSSTGALTISDFTAVSANEYTVLVTGMSSGENVTLTLTASGSGIQDEEFNALPDDATATVAYTDVTAPTATITPDATTSNDDPLLFTITFGEDVVGVDAADVSATGSETGDLTMANFTEVSPAVYTVEVSGMESGEEVTLTLTASGSGIQDDGANDLVDDATATVTYDDVTQPTATITPDGAPSNDDPIVFTITFDEAVTGVDVADLSATGSVTGDLTLASFTAVSTTEYTVEVTGMQSGEEVTLTLTASGSGIQDDGSNDMVADATATATYVDVAAPTAAIAPDATVSNDDPIVFTITFDEEVTGVDVADLSATGSATGALTLANFTAVSATEYTVQVSGMSSGEDVTLALTASGSGIEDEASNDLAADATATVVYDAVAPTAAITPDAGTSNDDPIVFTITFDEAVTGVDIADLSASGSVTGDLNLSNFTAVSATEYAVEVTGMESGEDVTLTLTASGSEIEDAATNALTVDATATVAHEDVTAPTAAIAPDATSTDDDPIVFTITFDEEVTGVDIADLSASGSVTGSLTLANFTAVSATEYTVEVSGMSSDEDVTLSLTASGSGIEDEASNALAADTTGTVAYDVTAPTATITPDAAASNHAPIVFTISFDEAVTGVDVADLSASGSVTGDLTLANFTTVSATEYTVEVSGMSSGEDVTLTLTPSGSGIEDAATNALAADATATVTFDTAAPTATITPDETTSNDNPIVFTITFGEAVTGVDVADLSATGSVTGDLTLANFAAVSETEYTVEVSGMTSDEDVTLTLTASGSGIEDAAANALAVDADATVAYDDIVAPTAAITPNGTTDDAAPIPFVITFDEAVTGVDVADFSATGSVTGSLTVTDFAAISATEYRVSVVGMTADEDVTLTLTASGSGIVDEGANALAADATATVTYLDVRPPIATITPDATASNDDPIVFTITFDEEVTGVDVADLSATGSTTGDLTLANFTAVSATEYTVVVSGMSSGEDVTLLLTASGSGIQDEELTDLAADATATVTYDAAAPTATITPDAIAGNDNPIVFTITFDEDVSGVDIADLSATGSTTGDLTLANFTAVSGTEYTVEVSGMASGEDVTLTLTASGSGIEDAATNSLAADVAATVAFDTAAPTAAITPNGTTSTDDPIVFTITFGEDVTGVDIADLLATGSTTGSLTLANFVAISATEYTVEVSGMASGEDVALTLTASGSGIEDEAGNALAADVTATVTYGS